MCKAGRDTADQHYHGKVSLECRYPTIQDDRHHHTFFMFGKLMFLIFFSSILFNFEQCGVLPDSLTDAVIPQHCPVALRVSSFPYIITAETLCK